MDDGLFYGIKLRIKIKKITVEEKKN